MKNVAVLVLVVAMTLAAARAGDPLRVTVASASGRSVFLDHGRGAGITPGLRIRLYPPGGTTLELVIADATTNSARVDIPDGVTLPPLGTVGELDLPEPVKPESKPEKPKAAVPEHPPWTRKDEPRAPDQPLLAPAYSKPSKDRPPAYHGRFFTQFQYSADRSGDLGSDYLLARLGARVYATNPFGQGGKLQFAGSIDRRSVSVEDGQNSSDDDLTIDRLSYAIGGEKYSSYRLEGGRFMSIFLPELGLVDGVEGAIQFEGGVRIGVGGGSYPGAFPDRETGDDLGVHVFADYQSDSDDHMAATLGFQKTWHEGAADRDVLIGRISLMPVKSVWLFGSAKVDINTPGDDVKSAGPHLTEAFAQARWSPDRTGGVSVSFSHFTYPDIQRNEFQALPVELIQTGRVDRADLTAWYEIVKDLRLTGRANYWSDQRGDGYGGGLDADWDKALDLPASLHAGTFFTSGSYSDTMGFRVEARPGTGDIRGLVGYEYLRYSAVGLIGGSDDDHVRHTVRGGLSVQYGQWFYNLTADHYFGETEDAYSLGLYVEYRF